MNDNQSNGMVVGEPKVTEGTPPVSNPIALPPVPNRPATVEEKRKAQASAKANNPHIKAAKSVSPTAGLAQLQANAPPPPPPPAVGGPKLSYPNPMANGQPAVQIVNMSLPPATTQEVGLAALKPSEPPPVVTEDSETDIPSYVLPGDSSAPPEGESVPAEALPDIPQIPQYEFDFRQAEMQLFTEQYWIGLTADAPFQYVTVPGMCLTKFVEPVEGKNSRGEENRIPKRGLVVALTNERRQALVETILRRGMKFRGNGFGNARDFKLPCPIENYPWKFPREQPLGWYVYFLSVKQLKRMGAFDFLSVGQHAFVPHTLVKRPANSKTGFEVPIMPDLKLEDDIEHITLRLPKGIR